MNRRRLLVRVLAVVVLVAAAVYALRARAIDRDVRAGAEAYAEVCDRLTASAAATGSPGAVAQLLAALPVELERLAERYPRWYDSYRSDPSRYPCGETVPNTQVGSDR